MAVILDPGAEPDFAPSINTGTGPIYLPNVTQLRGTNSLEEVITLNTLAANTLSEFAVGLTLQFFKLLPGAANVAFPSLEVAPLDYNAITNNVHWRSIGGFGISLMAGTSVANSANVSIPNNVNTALTFDTVRFNSGEWVSTSPSRITCLVDGIYSISGSVSFASSAVGSRKVSIRLNGSTEIATQQPVGTAPSAGSATPVNLSVGTIMQLNAGDYIELIVLQTAGSALNVLSGASYSPEFSAIRLSSLIPSEEGSVVTPPETEGVGNTVEELVLTDAGWYRVWTGPYPASGNFQIERTLANGDGSTSDTLIDFTVIGNLLLPPEGYINIRRNAIPDLGTPSIDGVRVAHLQTAASAYVDVHVTRAGLWRITHRADDANYLTAPFLVPDDLITPLLADAVLNYTLKSNVTGGTGIIDFPEWDVGGLLFAKPQADLWEPWTGTNNRISKDTVTGTLTNALQTIKALLEDLIEIGILRVGLAASMLYSAMLNLSQVIVNEGSVANDSDIFRVSVAPDTTAQGIYTPFGTLNAHTRYFLQGYEWSVANGRCEWSTFWSTWTIYNEAGTRLYHSGAAEATPWAVVQWKDEAAVNAAVTTVAPNIPLTFNQLTDTHTAEVVTGTTAGTFDGLYLRVADVGAKRSYKLVGTGTNNKRIEWSVGNTRWEIKDDSTLYATSTDAVAFPDQVSTWLTSSDLPAVLSQNAVDLMSGALIGGNATYNGRYVPIKGAYNNLSGRKLIYRRVDGLYYIENDGSSFWILDGISGTTLARSSTNGPFPWSCNWSAAGLTCQQNKVASPGWTANTAFPNLNTTGNWHL